MSEENLENRDKEQSKYPGLYPHRRAWSGLFLLLVGVLLMLKTANLILFPWWFFSWPVFLIVLGLFSGFRHRFRNHSWFILMAIGGIFLFNEMNPQLQLQRYTWPIILIFIGLIFILRPSNYKSWRSRRWRYNSYRSNFSGNVSPAETITSEDVKSAEAKNSDRRDRIDINTFFGGAKTNILSKNFKGGTITTVLGGAEVDLSQADFTGTITIDTSCILGGAKLIVPSTWDVRNDIAPIFGGVDDKRKISGINYDPDKLLILKGSCILGGIEIRSY